jgi:DNA-binding Lrp family transcriptional regulator
MRPLRDIDYKIISEYIKNSRMSDRELAKKVGVSQPTITRKRTIYEKEQLLEYASIPNFQKLGIEIVAFTFAVWSPEMLKNYPSEERIKKAQAFFSKHPNVIFASSGRGLGMGRMMISFHKNYSDYVEFFKQAEDGWAGLLTKLESFTISLETDEIVVPLSFKRSGEYLGKTE